ncbi:Putative WD40/YVTN repeat-like-containing domain superfamily, mRNA export factor Gle2/RAE1 [Septoria linicola]|uniref:WD40/YVTN repeat-like-containing domain superfamily, mRNA export factor Gle2/RAE1 n=1 Tax=Septoria linicola TaxID=215465 RepID=A0A9Q9B867_9PEZI|nr:putative WD40/YVTN repeat-like-containing domain superfamily, mRNA export factor Gle2/RAE1 [Septoria linicola]USW58836.1 Putative WD40/YVTN repeat-like-containing domain superfamily, mRNA export factor Gle2/RAE1 [Septoria linicola]
MAGIFGSAAASNANPTQGDLSKDVEVAQPPEDSVSAIKFSPASNHLSVASWDKKVRIYEISATGQASGAAMFEFDGPVLDTCWSGDGQKVFGAGADKTARMLDLGAGQTSGQGQQVAAHDQPIKCIKSFNTGGNTMIVTGSWDKTIKYWDIRQQQAAATVDAKERVYSMDIRNDSMLVVGTAERNIHIINLQQPGTFFKSMQSPLKWQTRTISTFIDGTGFAVGSIEGRCAIQYIDEKDSGSNFSFKCHRQTPSDNRNISNVFAVNAISFHPQHGTFSTAGSDGTFHFWDKDAKHRLKGYPEVGGTIASTDFNKDGTIFAYAVSYDWSKGYQFNTPQTPNKIMLHPISGDECKPRPKATKR